MSEPRGNEAAVSGRRSILVADDAPMFRELASLFLARSGRVLTAGSGREALDLARRERPDVVVADLSMPEMNGDELCAQIKRDPALRGTPVIVVTGAGSSGEHERAVRAGADDVLEKPLSRVSLIRSVNHCLRLALYGLARVPLETDVRIADASGTCAWGRSRNLSRGGMFVEIEQPLEPEAEIALEFQVDEGHRSLAPTARVVWRRLPAGGPPGSPGMGLQFLKLDRDAARAIEDYVYEHADPEAPAR